MLPVSASVVDDIREEVSEAVLPLGLAGFGVQAQEDFDELIGFAAVAPEVSLAVGDDGCAAAAQIQRPQIVFPVEHPLVGQVGFEGCAGLLRAPPVQPAVRFLSGGGGGADEAEAERQ
jgi:hypothetical protein